jgi:ABC-type branched-subunit amino acid transport system substrate-binding protein
MSKTLMRLLAIFLAFGLIAAACGDDDEEPTATEQDAEEPAEEEPAEEEPAEEEPAEEEPAEEPAEEEPADEGDMTEAAYGPGEDCGVAGDGLNLGTLLPATGQLAFLGPPMIEAVSMAVCDINAAGGVNGAPIALTEGDSGTDPDIANTTVDRLIGSEGVDAIIGAAASGITGSVIDKITSAPVVQCSPSNTAAGLGTDGDDGFYFRTAPSDDLQAPALADVVLGDGFSNIAVVSRSDDYGVGFNEFFVPAIEAGGGTVVYDTPYDPNATSFDDVVTSVVGAGPDAVVLVAFEEGISIIQTMIEQGVGPDAIQIYITDGMATGELGAAIDEANPSIAAGIKGTQPSAAPESGAADFPANFETYAPGVDAIFSAQAYDCAIIIALAAQAAGSNEPADIQAEMVGVTTGGEKCGSFAECSELLAGGADIDYDGASGLIEFLDVGEPSVGVYDVYDYDADGVQQVLEQVTFNAAS